MSSTDRFVVAKFGGTSVATRSGWHVIAEVAQAHRASGLRPVVVCSALAGVTNLLEGILAAALEDAHAPLLAEVADLHRAHAAALGVTLDAAGEADLGTLARLSAGAALTGEVTPRVRARALATGELLATRLGAAFLAAQGLLVAWLDARDALRARPQAGPRGWLAVDVDDDLDADLVERLGAGAPVVVTQGFIARRADGDTALLGRGGSDTSGALFAAKLGAARCEIWTDVPGLYTTDPREIPHARLLRRLDYDEAQEAATAGAKVLHPRSLGPLRRHGIPLHVRCASHPDVPGTVIASDAPDAADVKCIATRRGVTLVSMDTLGMWQQIGFLADVFECFRRHGVSVDLVSTSETNVTASIDPAASAVDDATVQALLVDLGRHCRARLIRPCASISLVGRQIRGILHRLGPALRAFEAQRVHLVSQAASDLNLTFVVDEAQAPMLVRRLHALLFEERGPDAWLGPTWAETFGDAAAADADATTPGAWWRDRRDVLLATAEAGTPAYVYHGPTVVAAARRLVGLGAVERALFAMKANDHGEILRLLAAEGLGFETVSPGELAHLRATLPDLDADRVLYTPNFAPRVDYEAGFAFGARVTVDNLHPLEAWPELFRGREIFLRLDPGRGRGHHAHVRTAGAQSKFGIAADQLEAVAAAAKIAGARVVGLHAHAGSGILTPEAWPETAAFLAGVVGRFPAVRVLDLGGGLGVPAKPGQAPLDLEALDAGLGRARAAHPELALWLEPGRYLVAEAGVLLARVTQLKTKGEAHYVGVDAGMHTLLRPALYGAWHEVVNLSRLGEPATTTVQVVGPICETGDVLARDRRLPETREGDVLLIATAGAYGRVMSSGYNRRGTAREVVLG